VHYIPRQLSSFFFFFFLKREFYCVCGWRGIFIFFFAAAVATPRSSSSLAEITISPRKEQKIETINMNGKNHKRAFAVLFSIE
jgi:hypothetical protein